MRAASRRACTGRGRTRASGCSSTSTAAAGCSAISTRTTRRAAGLRCRAVTRCCRSTTASRPSIRFPRRSTTRSLPRPGRTRTPRRSAATPTGSRSVATPPAATSRPSSASVAACPSASSCSSIRSPTRAAGRRRTRSSRTGRSSRARRWTGSSATTSPVERALPTTRACRRCSLRTRRWPPLHRPSSSRLPPTSSATKARRTQSRLAEVGVPVEHRRYDGMFHGFFAMPERPRRRAATRCAFAGRAARAARCDRS